MKSIFIPVTAEDGQVCHSIDNTITCCSEIQDKNKLFEIPLFKSHDILNKKFYSFTMYESCHEIWFLFLLYFKNCFILFLSFSLIGKIKSTIYNSLLRIYIIVHKLSCIAGRCSLLMLSKKLNPVFGCKDHVKLESSFNKEKVLLWKKERHTRQN